MAERRQTALGVARARFVEGLPRKAREVRASVALLAGTPEDERPREELRRRLHALYASAQVFRIEPLAASLRDAIAGIDQVRDARRGFVQSELDGLASLAARLPSLGESPEEPVPAPSVPPAAPPAPEPPKPQVHAPKAQPKAHRPIESVVSVLVVDAPEHQALVRAALAPERFEVLGATDVEEALRLARSAAPDVVLADRALVLEPGGDLIGRLREDPLTDFVPVVLLLPPGAVLDAMAVRESGADEAISKPLEAGTVLRTVERVMQLTGPAGASTLTGTLTLEELAERLADEVKRGIVESAEKGRDVAVPMGDGSQLLAATWSAIGRVRAHVAERSGGRVRFREGPARGGPSFVTVVGEEAVEDDLPEGFHLNGRRIVVADDDPAVVWFFAGLLREHGADVVETSDGLEALEEARRHRPDLVVSDILMPQLDGFGLTRALKRDPVLADVPVILISWKEDFLQRMRELKAGASGYLRKEAAAVQILTAVRDVLRPRARLESRLKAGGDVRGRIEDVGVQTLVSTVAALRPDARLTMRDASSLYEVDLRDAEVVDANRTAPDGAYARGPRVFEAVLGITAGRFTVADADGPVRKSIREPLAVLLETGTSTLAAHVDAVSGKNLSRVEAITLDEDLVASLLRSSPEDVSRIVEHLRAGGSPRALLLDGYVEPQVLEEVLVHLARQGAIRAVRGPDGEDRVAAARQARQDGVHAEAELSARSWLPRASSEPARSDADSPAGPRKERTSEIPTLDEPFGDSVPPPLPGNAPGGAPHAGDVLDGDAVLAIDDEDEDEDEDAEVSLEVERAAEDVPEIAALHDGVDAGESRPATPPPVSADPPEPVASDPEPAADAAPSEPPPPHEKAASLRLPPPPKLVTPADARSHAGTPARDAETQGMGLVGWALVLVVLAAIGFVGYRLIATPGPAPDEPVPRSLPDPPEVRDVPGDPSGGTEPERGSDVDETQDELDLPAAYGREVPGIAELGVEVPNGRGLLVLEPSPGWSLVVELGERRLIVRDEPMGVALEPGVHHLAISRGDHRDLVWVPIRAGHTRYLPPLP